MPWWNRRRRTPVDGLRVGPGVQIPISPRDGRERVRVALSGISAELARLPWDWWHETPQPGQVIYVDGDPRDYDPSDLQLAVRTPELFRVTSFEPLRIERGPFYS
jgi:hypothetical protein